jgi:hypothetical protein
VALHARWRTGFSFEDFSEHGERDSTQDRDRRLFRLLLAARGASDEIMRDIVREWSLS